MLVSDTFVPEGNQAMAEVSAQPDRAMADRAMADRAMADRAMADQPTAHLDTCSSAAISSDNVRGNIK